MQVQKELLSDTRIKLLVTADQAIMNQVKQATIERLSQDIKVPGFRPGKAPANLVEKHLSQSQLQTEFLDQAVNHLYVESIKHEDLRPVAQPEINLSKFVPYTTLEFTATVEIVGAVMLPDYTKMKLTAKSSPVSAKDVNQVLDNLLGRAAAKKEISRAAKSGDEVIIDFKGNDAKTKEPISGADGKDYALLLGSGSFIPGFEDKLVGIKPGAETSFTLTFPKDYNVKALQNQKVTFNVTLHKVLAVTKPKLDDAFAASVGSFKRVSELKADIKKQLEAERLREEKRAYENELLQNITEKSSVAIPVQLIDEEIDRMEDEEKHNIAYRGQTWQEHLDEEGLSADAHREKQRVGAGSRVKAGLVLSEIANKENITASPEELEIRIQLLKGQYQDPKMLGELDKPENRRDILSRLLTEKTLEKLRTYASS